MQARRFKSLHGALGDELEVLRDALRREDGAQMVHILRLAGEDGDVRGVALVAGACVRDAQQRLDGVAAAAVDESARRAQKRTVRCGVGQSKLMGEQAVAPALQRVRVERSFGAVVFSYRCKCRQRTADTEQPRAA